GTQSNVAVTPDIFASTVDWQWGTPVDGLYSQIVSTRGVDGEIYLSGAVAIPNPCTATDWVAWNSTATGMTYGDNGDGTCWVEGDAIEDCDQFGCWGIGITTNNVDLGYALIDVEIISGSTSGGHGFFCLVGEHIPANHLDFCHDGDPAFFPQSMGVDQGMVI